MRPVGKAAILSIVLFLLLAAVLGALTVRRSLKGSNDFDTFYHAGREAITSGPLYYTDENYGYDEGRGPFLYPPFAACVFSLFSLLPLRAAAFLWAVFNLVLFGASVRLIFYLLGMSRKEVLDAWRKLPFFDKAVLAAMPAVLFLDNALMAQVNILVFFLTLTALAFWHQQKQVLGGIALAAAILIKVTPALFCVYFLLKKQWRFLGGTMLGGILFTFVLPSLLWGTENSRIYHRQWAGRTVKPILIDYLPEEDRRPLKHFPNLRGKFRHDRLTGRLTQKNQSLEAAVTRLFLKDRNSYAYERSALVYPVRRYMDLPVLFGGLAPDGLGTTIRLLQGFILLLLLWFWGQSRSLRNAPERALEWALVFLSMTLLAPWVRSHQYIVWLFAYFSYLYFFSLIRGSGFEKFSGGACACLLFSIFCRRCPTEKPQAWEHGLI